MQFASNLYYACYDGSDNLVFHYRNPILSEFENNVLVEGHSINQFPIGTNTKAWDPEQHDSYCTSLFSGFARVIVSYLDSEYPMKILAFLGFSSDGESYWCSTEYSSPTDYTYGFFAGYIPHTTRPTLYSTISYISSIDGILFYLSNSLEFTNSELELDHPFLLSVEILETEVITIYSKEHPMYIDGKGASNSFKLEIWASYLDKGYDELLSKYEYTVTNQDIELGNIITYEDDDGQNIYYFSSTSSINDTIFTITLNYNTDITTIVKVIVGKDPYAPNNPSSPGGGNGNYGNGEIRFPTVGLIPEGTTEANDSQGTMYTRYLVSLNEMNVLGQWLWADDLGLQVAKTIVSALYGDPVQTVISCVSYPFNLSSIVSSSSTPFHWGGHDAGFSLTALNQNAFSVNWGTIAISEYWGNFLDYSPHTQMQLYLPWGTGFVHIDPNDILNSNPDSSLTGMGTLGVKTNVDLSRGICVHHVIANETVIGSYSGSCGRQIPITGSDYASKQVAMAGAAIGAIAAGGVAAGAAYSQYSNLVAVPNPNGRYSGGSSDGILRRQDARGRYHDMQTGRFVSAPTPIRYDVVHGEVDRGAMTRLAANAARPAIASAAALLVSPPSVSRSGSFQEGAGSLSIQQPYLIISRPKMSMPDGYGNLYGYPSNIYMNLGSLSGYTEIGAIHLDGLPATAEEISELDSLLKGGVIF